QIQLILTKSDSSLNDNDFYFIEHSIDENEFKQIGSLNIRLIKQNQNSAHIQSFNEEDEDEQVYDKSTNSFSTRIESSTFDQDTLNQFKKAIKTQGSIYRVRLCKKIPSHKCFASSFTYVRNIADAGYRINMTLNTGVNNILNGLSLKTTSLPLKKQNDQALEHITFLVNVQNIKLGQQPDTETYMEKIKIEKEQKEKGAQAENQSFLSKYWMYIVPFVVIMFLANIVNPEAAAAGGGSA
ncbi:unnamed protein product, partial [Brachionus calyciflorus]